MFPPPRCASTIRFHVPPRARIDKIIQQCRVVNFTARRWRRRGRKCASVSRRNAFSANGRDTTRRKRDLYERIRRGGVQQVRSSSHRRDAYNIAVVVTTFNNIIDAHFTRPCRRWPRHTRREIGRGAEMRFVTLLGSMGDDGGIGFRARSPGVRARRSRSAVNGF